MKKLIVTAFLSLAAVGFSSSQASAWPLEKLCCKNCCTLCIRQYNAFTPTCSGTVWADGCCPFSPYNPAPTNLPAYGSYSPECCGGDGHVISAPATTIVPAPIAPQFQPPMPSPAPSPKTTFVPVQTPYGVLWSAGQQPGYFPGNQAGYQAGYYPGYNPMLPANGMNYGR